MKIRHSHAKSGISTKENILGVCFQLRKPPANNQCAERIREKGSSFTLGLREAEVGKRQGLLSRTNVHWAGITSLYFARRNIPASFWGEFVKLLSGANHLFFYVLIVKRIFFRLFGNQAFPKRRKHWEWVSN